MTQPWYPFFWSDYSGSTFNLTQGQHGAHLLFMRHIYTTGKPIPHNQRFSIARAMSEQEQADADYVLSAHYQRDGDSWHNAKCETVMSEAEEKHQKRVDAGKKGGKAKSQRSSNATPMPEQSSSNHNQNHNHIDTDVSITDIPGPVRVLFDGAFQALWHAYPGYGKHGQVSEAFKGTKAKAQDAYFQQIIKTKEQDREAFIRTIADGAGRYDHFLKQSGGLSKHLSTWLAERGWEPSYAIDRAPGDPVSGRTGGGQKPGSSVTVLGSASRAIERIRASDEGGRWAGGPTDDHGLRQADGIAG